MNKNKINEYIFIIWGLGIGDWAAVSSSERFLLQLMLEVLFLRAPDGYHNECDEVVFEAGA